MSGKPTAYWQEIAAFWTTYFQKSGASLRDFSALRELPGDSGGAMK
jgi:hypothetical protein